MNGSERRSLMQKNRVETEITYVALWEIHPDA